MNCQKKIKIGLFGGTFAPPHLGHIHAVNAILDSMDIDEIIIMPTFIPPHKVKVSGDTPELRLEMCRAAFSGISRVTVSDYEIQRGGISYTVQTLEYLSSPEREIYLICGTDMFMTLDTWFRAERIFRLAKIVCVPRDETEAAVLKEKILEYAGKYGAATTVLASEPIDVSSTEIRRKIEYGEDLAPFLPETVINIIKRDELYNAKNNT